MAPPTMWLIMMMKVVWQTQLRVVSESRKQYWSTVILLIVSCVQHVFRHCWRHVESWRLFVDGCLWTSNLLSIAKSAFTFCKFVASLFVIPGIRSLSGELLVNWPIFGITLSKPCLLSVIYLVVSHYWGWCQIGILPRSSELCRAHWLHLSIVCW